MIKFLTTDNAPTPIGSYSQAVIHQGLLYASGQIALSPRTGELVGKNVAAQTRQSLDNLTAILTDGGTKIEHILKVVIYLKNIDDFSLVNEVYTQWIGEHRPARSTVAALDLPRRALVEIECIAALTS